MSVHLHKKHPDVAESRSDKADGRILSLVDSPAPGHDREPIDPAVVRLAVAGEEAAFSAIVRWYHQRFSRFALHMLRAHSDAEDAVQEAFIRIYRALPYYRERDRFEPWIFRILANCCRTALGREKRSALRLVSLDSPEAASVQSQSANVDNTSWRKLLDIALDSLPVEQREAFLLHHVDGHSYEAMSQITGLGQSALKMRVKRACDKIRDFLAQESHV